MMSRRRATDRELVLLLLGLILLLLTAHSVNDGLNLDENAFAQDDIIQATPTTYHASTNPFWAPPHAFPRRPAPVYSDVQATDASE